MTAYKKDSAPKPWERAGEEYKCFYPNCSLREGIDKADARVVWDVRLELETIYSMFPPVVKLAIKENSTIHEKYPSKPLSIYLHPECAAEWGMQLITDALEANYRVGRRLSNREKEWGHHDEE